MTALPFLVPDAVDDPRHPSGGNRYDRELAAALEAAGRAVELRRAGPGTAVGPILAAIEDGGPALVDGLLLEAEGSAALPGTAVPLLHMPPRSGSADRAVAAAPAVLTTSAWTRRVILDRLPLAPAAVTVAPPGVSPVRPVRTEEPGRRLRCVAALLPAKGQHVLVEALAGMVDLAWSCELVGAADLDPEYTDRIRRRVADLGLADRIRIVGPLAAEPLERLYAGADLVVLPSRTESYGMVLAEAIACGVPVLAFDVGGVREAVPATPGRRPGVLLPPTGPAVLRAELRRWLTDAAHRRRLTRAARSRVASVGGWSGTAAAVAGVLDDVTAGRHRSGAVR